MAALYFDATGLAYSFDDGHIAVRTVHSVKHVPTHQSSVTDTAEVTLSVNNDATHLSRITTPSAGTPRQICRDFRHHILRKIREGVLNIVFVAQNFCP